MTDVYLDTAQAAVATGTSESTIRRRVRAGELRNYGTARCVVVSLDEATALLGDPLDLTPELPTRN